MMMTKIRSLFLTLIGAVMLCAPALAEDRGSEAEALALLGKAASFVEHNGPSNAQAEFSDASKGYIDRDLYVTILALDGTMLAHGANPALVGKNLIGLKDLDKKAFIAEAIESAKQTGKGFVDYKWTDPLTKKLRDKRMHFVKVGDVVVNVGVYK